MNPNPQAQLPDPQPVADEISLVDLVMPLYRRKKFLGLGAVVLAVGCVVGTFALDWVTRATGGTSYIVNLAVGMSYDDFRQLNGMEWPGLGKLGFTYKFGDKDPRFPTGRDSFVGYYEANKLIQADVDTVMVSATNGTIGNLQDFVVKEQAFKAIHDLISDNLKSVIPTVPIDLFKLVDPLKPVDPTQKLTVVDLIRELQKIEEKIALLQKFQSIYPSLIRSNLTLNDKVVPVETQIMDAELNRKLLRETLDDIALKRAIQYFYRAIPDLSDPVVEALKKLRDKTLVMPDLQAGILSRVAIAFDQTMTKFNFEETPTSLTRAQLEDYLASERNNLERTLIDQLSAISLQTKVAEQGIAGSLSDQIKTMALVFVAGLFLLVLWVYGAQLAGRLRTKLEDVQR